MKGRPFIHFIYNIAICDCITSLTYSWGFLPKGNLHYQHYYYYYYLDIIIIILLLSLLLRYFWM